MINLPKVILPILAVAYISACTPTVKLQAPEKPIEINLNVKIEQEVRVKVDRDLDTLFEEDSDIFGVPTNDTSQ